MTTALIASAAELERVPDGTIISWLRIPGDSTSEAVAFVRVEAWRAPMTGETGRDVWISPGGWDPMSVEQAGVSFPATVIRWGEVAISEEPPVAVGTLDSGGAYTRIAALDAAVQLFRGDSLYVLPRNGEGPNLQPVLDTAKVFETHLLRDDLADALNATVDCGLVTEEQARRAYQPGDGQ